ncbi:MAG: SIS domain-containing protein [Pyrinomonadaceae bacterium]
MEVKVFTNGCFDIIHPGHIDFLRRAGELGTNLIVGINSDSSIRAIKGKSKPYMNEIDRKAILQAIKFVDQVYIFNETTPESLIKKINPDVLVKGGDWTVDEIVGSDFVLKKGGKVLSLALLENYSSSSIAEKIKNSEVKNLPQIQEKNGSRVVVNALKTHIQIFEQLLKSEIFIIEECAELIYRTFLNGNKVLICGNGGSAADAQHIAAEFVGRYEVERKALPVIALTTDTSALTALANDYSFEKIFSRQIEALGAKNDLLIAISTSGNSSNVNAAVMSARQIGCKTIGLTGSKGKKLASLCDTSILVPATRTARIQEAHIAIGHIWCEIIDLKFQK